MMAARGFRDLDMLNALDVRRRGISPATLYQHKRGLRRPSLEMARLYADVLGCSLDELEQPEAALPGAVTVPGTEDHES